MPENTINENNAKSKSNGLTNSSYSAFELYDLKIEKLPKLLDPFFQKVGLASLVGTSDTGKSTLLRQLSLAIGLKQEKFLGFKLNTTSGKVLYVSTEDDPTSIAHSIRKQIESIEKKHENLDKELLKNIEFIFDTHKLLENLTKKLDANQYDLIIIDAFADVFTKEINANTQVRQFLDKFDKLAKQKNTLIIFLHHIGKRTTNYKPSKNSIIGSQGFEAKMRSVLELRPNLNSTKLKDLWVLKSNFMGTDLKKQSYILKFGEDLIFTNTEKRGSSQSSKTQNPKIQEKVISLRKQGLPIREIESALKGTEYSLGRTGINKIVKEHKIVIVNPKSKPKK